MKSPVDTGSRTRCPHEIPAQARKRTLAQVSPGASSPASIPGAPIRKYLQKAVFRRLDFSVGGVGQRLWNRIGNREPRRRRPTRARVDARAHARTGLRIGELLGLTWDDVDFDTGVAHVRKQIDRTTGQRVTPKTSRSQRQVVLMPALGGMLRRHRLASPHSLGGDFVFASISGRPLHYRDVVRRGLDKAASKAGLNPPGVAKLRFHDLRRTYASLLISEGLNVVFVSRQLGHASPDITLRVYAHLFDQAEHTSERPQLWSVGSAIHWPRDGEATALASSRSE